MNANQKILNILVSEDNPEYVKQYTEELNGLPVAFNIVDNDNSLLEKFKEDIYDLVVVTYHPSGLNGIDAIKEMRKLTRNSDLPEVPMYLISTEGVRTAALNAGASYFLTKPLSRGTLKEIVNRYLDAQVCLRK